MIESQTCIKFMLRDSITAEKRLTNNYVFFDTGYQRWAKECSCYHTCIYFIYGSCQNKHTLLHKKQCYAYINCGFSRKVEGCNRVSEILHTNSINFRLHLITIKYKGGFYSISYHCTSALHAGAALYNALSFRLFLGCRLTLTSSLMLTVKMFYT